RAFEASCPGGSPRIRSLLCPEGGGSAWKTIPACEESYGRGLKVSRLRFHQVCHSADAGNDWPVIASSDLVHSSAVAFKSSAPAGASFICFSSFARSAMIGSTDLGLLTSTVDA